MGRSPLSGGNLRTIAKPRPEEYPAYAYIYIVLLPDDGQILKHLDDNLRSTRIFIESIPRDRLLHRYAEGKWTIKEILMHMMDAERVWGYRALRFARNDQTKLPGFDEQEYVPSSKAANRKIKSLLREYEAVRNATVELFENLDEENKDNVDKIYNKFQTNKICYKRV